MLGADTFLLDQRNRNFVEGRARRPINPTLPGCMVLFMVPFLVAGVFTMWLTFDAWYRLVGFNLAPRTAEAMVVDKGIAPDDEGDDDPYLVYRYTARAEDGGGRYTDRAYVSWSDYAAFEPEDILTIEYIAYSPDRSRPAGKANALGEAGFLTCFTLFWNGVTFPLFVILLRSRAKSMRLKRKGMLIGGTLTSYETSTDSDNDLWVKISYSFLSPAGLLVRGTDSSMHNELRNTPAPAPGTPVAVLYVDERTHTVL